MRRILWLGILVTLAVWGMTACKPGLLPTEEPGNQSDLGTG